MLEKIRKQNKISTNFEKQFLDYFDQNFYQANLNEKVIYPFKKDCFKFIILSNNSINKEDVYDFFKGFLNEILCFQIDNNVIIIYHNKERIHFKDLYESISDDMGFLVKLFEGCTIEIAHMEYFNVIIDLYYKYIDNKKNDYYSVRDLIIEISKDNPKILEKLKEIIFYKFIKDSQFEKMIKSMFHNNLNVSKTAQDIYMHRNTINNKLDAIERETGLQLQKFKDAVAIYELYK